MWPIIAGAALLGGIGNLISNSAQAKAINERIRRAQELAAEGLIDSDELSQRLQGIDRMFNQRLISTLNTTALRSRGYANRGTIGAAVAGGIEGGRLEARSAAVGEAQGINAQVQQNIAQLALGGETADPVGSFVSGAVSGASVGIQASNILGGHNIDVPEDAPGEGMTSVKTDDYLSTGGYDSIDAGFGSYNKSGLYKTGLGTWQSPLAGLTQVDDDELYNFFTPGTWGKLVN